MMIVQFWVSSALGRLYKAGVAVEVRTATGQDQWHFVPQISGRRITTGRTMKECLPKWLNYPDRCESAILTEQPRAYRSKG